MALAHKLFTSLQNYNDPDTRIGELNRIWYDGVNNVFRIQLDNTTPGGTIIGGGGAGGNYTLPVATSTVLGGVKIGANISINAGVISVDPGTGTGLIVGQDDPTINRPIIYDATFENTLSIGTQTFYTHTNGFSVNENWDITNPSGDEESQSPFTGYHFTSGAGKIGVAFTLARTGSFTDGFGITGDASNNQFVIGSETANTDYVFKTNIGMPFDVSGGTTIFTINRDGSITFPNDTTQSTAAVAQIQSDWTQTNNASLDYIKNKPNLTVQSTRLVNTASYLATTSDYYIGVNRTGTVAITLPTPSDGYELVIKDESGTCATYPISIVGTIDNDAGGATLSINNGALHLIYRSGWRII